MNIGTKNMREAGLKSGQSIYIFIPVFDNEVGIKITNIDYVCINEINNYVLFQPSLNPSIIFIPAEDTRVGINKKGRNKKIKGINLNKDDLKVVSSLLSFLDIKKWTEIEFLYLDQESGLFYVLTKGRFIGKTFNPFSKITSIVINNGRGIETIPLNNILVRKYQKPSKPKKVEKPTLHLVWWKIREDKEILYFFYILYNHFALIFLYILSF